MILPGMVHVHALDSGYIEFEMKLSFLYSIKFEP